MAPSGLIRSMEVLHQGVTFSLLRMTASCC